MTPAAIIALALGAIVFAILCTPPGPDTPYDPRPEDPRSHETSASGVSPFIHGEGK